ncbi:hypothetical protein BH11BAC6_BH11BAC6_02050 [soil metagenome]
MELNYIHLLLLLVPVTVLYWLLIYKVYDKLEKLYVSIIFWGLYFYGGIGASSYEVDKNYTFYFLLFIAAFVFFYRLRYISFHAVRNQTFYFFRAKSKHLLEKKSYEKIFIGSYLFVCFLFLVYPDFKVADLFHPPSPEGVSALISSVESQNAQNVDVLSKILFYVKLLVAPLYFIGLYNYRKKPLLLFVFIFLPLYFDYCANNYIGRGMILMACMLWFFAVYAYNQRLRRPMVIGGIVGIPLLIAFFYSYSLARLGGDIEVHVDAAVIEQIFYQEINFPESFKSVAASGMHVDFFSFLVWITTLPIPKVLLGGLIEVPVLNFDLSEIVLGMHRYDDGFWVKLTGYVSESYYIFGPYFFWIEAFMIAWISKLLFYLLRSIKGTEILIIFIAIQFGFMFSRAGLGAVLPSFSNGFLLLYAYIILKLYIFYKEKKLQAQII